MVRCLCTASEEDFTQMVIPACNFLVNEHYETFADTYKPNVSATDGCWRATAARVPTVDKCLDRRSSCLGPAAKVEPFFG